MNTAGEAFIPLTRAYALTGFSLFAFTLHRPTTTHTISTIFGWRQGLVEPSPSSHEWENSVWRQKGKSLHPFLTHAQPLRAYGWRSEGKKQKPPDARIYARAREPLTPPPRTDAPFALVAGQNARWNGISLWWWTNPNRLFICSSSLLKLKHIL